VLPTDSFVAPKGDDMTTQKTIEPPRTGNSAPDVAPGPVARGRFREPAGADSKHELLAIMAHEFRNLLAPIRNGLRVLGRVPEQTEASAQARGLIERQVGRLGRLVDDLLDISYVNAGSFSLRPDRVDLAWVMREALEVSRSPIEAAGHQTVVSIPARPLFVNGDPTRLVQVFTNLLNNAAKYTPDGGHIWFSAERSAGEAVVRVRDTGAGVAAELLPRLFEMFVQAERTPGRCQRGFGIGLPLVRRLVELHGGRVEARSEGRWQGSEFIVRLPLAADGSGEPERREGPQCGGNG
jgi:signal transduction histidine kinase